MVISPEIAAALRRRRQATGGAYTQVMAVTQADPTYWTSTIGETDFADDTDVVVSLWAKTPNNTGNQRYVSIGDTGSANASLTVEMTSSGVRRGNADRLDFVSQTVNLSDDADWSGDSQPVHDQLFHWMLVLLSSTNEIYCEMFDPSAASGAGRTYQSSLMTFANGWETLYDDEIRIGARHDAVQSINTGTRLADIWIGNLTHAYQAAPATGVNSNNPFINSDGTPANPGANYQYGTGVTPKVFLGGDGFDWTAATLADRGSLALSFTRTGSAPTTE